MATLHDTALGSNDASGTSLATTDALAVTTGDLIFVIAKWEGAAGSTASVTDGTNSYSTANAQLAHGNGDMQMQTFYAIAASSGTINPTVGLSSARPYRKILAYSVTPAGGQEFTTVGNVAAATGTGAAVSSGSASATAAGFAGVGVTYYATDSLAAGSGWTIPAEFSADSALKSEYQLQTGAGSLTGDGTSVVAGAFIAQMAIFNESASGGGGGGGTPLMGQACL